MSGLQAMLTPGGYTEITALLYQDAALAGRLLDAQVECEQREVLVTVGMTRCVNSDEETGEDVGRMETDETPERGTAAGYFITIIAVLGGALLISSFTFFFTTIAPLLLLILTPVLLIGSAKYRQQKRLLERRSAATHHSQEPVVVSQSSTSSDMCDSAPWR